MSTEPAMLSSLTTATIVAVARTLYPHDALPDDVYARVGAKLADAACEDPETARTIDEGVAALADPPFEERDQEEQVDALRAIEGSDFFELVRSTAVVEVYSDPRTWELVGYEGPSFDKGGYLHRGYDDLDWLPDPEEPA
jgi:hypothetical protein